MKTNHCLIEENYWYCEKDGHVYEQEGKCPLCSRDLIKAEPDYRKVKCECGKETEATVEYLLRNKCECGKEFNLDGDKHSKNYSSFEDIVFLGTTELNRRQVINMQNLGMF
jgi:hypothetical protein